MLVEIRCKKKLIGNMLTLLSIALKKLFVLQEATSEAML
jgi:hypothetical protein